MAYTDDMTHFLLDSGDITEDLDIIALAKAHDSEIWGATTNPSLIAKILKGQKIASREEAFSVLQKHIVENILETVPGAVSAEVYADEKTTAEEMVSQGMEIASWHQRIAVKLPTTLEGLKARTILRKHGVCINNTLVFSQEQIYAITLHEKFMLEEFGAPHTSWPCFISPFIGRLYDHGQDGMSLLYHANTLLSTYFADTPVWLLASSIRNTYHVQACLQAGMPLLTAPAKVYKEWWESPLEDHPNPNPDLPQIPAWEPNEKIKNIKNVSELISAIESKEFSIDHPLTTEGVQKFVASWQGLFSE